MIIIHTMPRPIRGVRQFCVEVRTDTGKLENVRRSMYHAGIDPPNFTVPTVPLAVKYDYPGCVNVDDVTDPDDPIIVYMYDSWEQRAYYYATLDR